MDFLSALSKYGKGSAQQQKDVFKKFQFIVNAFNVKICARKNSRFLNVTNKNKVKVLVIKKVDLTYK